MKNIIQFNNVLDASLKYINDNFQDCQEITNNISKFKILINGIRNMDNLFLYEIFQKYVKKYKKQICDCDENFFLNEFDRVLHFCDKNNGSDIQKSDALLFKKIWEHENCTDIVKANIFLYFNKSVKLL